MVARWEGIKELSEKGNGIMKYTLVVTNSHSNVKNSIGNMFYNIMRTTRGVMGVLDLLKKSVYKLYKCLTTMCIPETNIILNINCN